MAEDLLGRAVEALADGGPWPAGRGTALAVSGGADSTFLMHAWAAFALGRDLPARALVVDHGLRPSSAAEAAAAAGAAEGLGLEAAVLRVTPAGHDEAALREARYAALVEAMRAGREAVLLLGHHADDQAETVLLRLLRGSGLRGLAGMPARRELAHGLELRRPLLGLRAGAIRAWLRAEGVAWTEDPSNAEPGAAARNRLRLGALPALAEVRAGDPLRGLLRLAEEAGGWEEARAELAARLPWDELPAALRRQELADWLRARGETPSPARLRDLEAALLARGRAGVRAGLEVRTRDGRLEAAGED